MTTVQMRLRLGIGPIAWVNDDLRDWGRGTPAEQVMAEMARAGYAGTEMSYVYPSDPAELRQALARHGLELCGAYRWTSFSDPERHAAEVAATCAFIDQAAAAGARHVNVAEGAGSRHWDPAGERATVRPLTAAGWDGLVQGLHACGAYARERGVVLAFHPHADTAVLSAGEIDELMARTDPELVGLCADSAHIAYGGSDPVAVFQRHGRRIRYVHAKDLRPQVLARVKRESLAFAQAVRLGVFTVPGQGSLDFAALWAALATAGYSGWLVVEAEQDPALYPPLAQAQLAREFIRRTVGV